MGTLIQGLPDPHNIHTWQVQEDITPLDPGSSAGGVGQITFSTTDWPLSRMLSGTDVVLKDSIHGMTVGTVRDVDGDGVTLGVTADSELGKMNAVRTTGPYTGTLEGLFQHYLNLANVYAPLNFQAINVVVNVPGFVGNVWDKVKQLCSAHGVEIAQVGDEVVVRRARTNTVRLPNETSYGFNLNRQEASLAVDVAYYNNKWIDKGEVYPVSGEEPSIHSVGAGEVAEFELTINASLSRVYQPVCAENIGPGSREGTDGAYTVVGNDNLPIKPAQWIASGGRVEVSLTDEPGRILLRVTGAQIEHLSPFRIAESAGGTDYNSLHITGDGVAWQQESVRIFTGADPLKVSSEIGNTVDNPYITSKGQALRTGVHSAIAASGAKTAISGGTNRIHGQDQTFGNVVGSRLRKDFALYRIDSVTTGPEGLSFDASLDTRVSDFNEVWAGHTTEQFNTLWEEATSAQVSLYPLRTPPKDSDTLDEDSYGGGLYGSGPYGDGG